MLKEIIFQIKKKTVTMLGGQMMSELQEIEKIKNKYFTVRISSLRKLRDWRRGMQYKCKHTEGIEIANEKIQRVIDELPINK